MAHFASLDADNNVIKVHCVDNKQLLDVDGSESEEYGIMFLRVLHGGGRYKQTSYNTRGGEHQLGGTPLRANYCGAGWAYSDEHDIFHPAQPYPSWSLDTVKGQWNPPVPMPEMEDGVLHTWNEEEQQWDEINMEDNNG